MDYTRRVPPRSNVVSTQVELYLSRKTTARFNNTYICFLSKKCVAVWFKIKGVFASRYSRRQFVRKKFNNTTLLFILFKYQCTLGALNFIRHLDNNFESSTIKTTYFHLKSSFSAFNCI